MKTLILCGGRGSRMSEETEVRPKPMVEVGARPMLWHIMNLYGYYGYKEFVLALGYKGQVIKDYFLNYTRYGSDLVVDLGRDEVEVRRRGEEDWRVHLIDTGLESMTGGRMWRLREYMGGEERFMMTYGDGVSDVDIRGLVDFHKRHGKLATVMAVRPMARFGNMNLDGSGDEVRVFKEKCQASGGWINGGFFVLERGVFDYLEGEGTVWEEGPLEKLAEEGELMAYRHEGFWKPMDTVRDRDELEEIWKKGEAPWKR